MLPLNSKLTCALALIFESGIFFIWIIRLLMILVVPDLAGKPDSLALIPVTLRTTNVCVCMRALR